MSVSVCYTLPDCYRFKIQVSTILTTVTAGTMCMSKLHRSHIEHSKSLAALPIPGFLISNHHMPYLLLLQTLSVVTQVYSCQMTASLSY